MFEKYICTVKHTLKIRSTQQPHLYVKELPQETKVKLRLNADLHDAQGVGMLR